MFCLRSALMKRRYKKEKVTNLITPLPVCSAEPCESVPTTPEFVILFLCLTNSAVGMLCINHGRHTNGGVRYNPQDLSTHFSSGFVEIILSTINEL